MVEREGSHCLHMGWCLLLIGLGIAYLLRLYLKLPWVHVWVPCLCSSASVFCLFFLIELCFLIHLTDSANSLLTHLSVQSLWWRLPQPSHSGQTQHLDISAKASPGYPLCGAFCLLVLFHLPCLLCLDTWRPLANYFVECPCVSPQHWNEVMEGGKVAQSCHPSTGETQAGGLWV